MKLYVLWMEVSAILYKCTYCIFTVYKNRRTYPLSKSCSPESLYTYITTTMTIIRITATESRTPMAMPALAPDDKPPEIIWRK